MIWNLVFRQIFDIDSIFLWYCPLSALTNMKSIQLIIHLFVSWRRWQKLCCERIFIPSSIFTQFYLKFHNHDNIPINFKHILTWLQHHYLLNCWLLSCFSWNNTIHLWVSITSNIQHTSICAVVDMFNRARIKINEIKHSCYHIVCSSWIFCLHYCWFTYIIVFIIYIY